MIIPEKNDPVLITTIREKGVESIVEWFEQHKQSFYALGWSYLRNEQQMEELFYRAILKVHKELPRFKNDTSFDTWVTSIFIHICRELSEEESLQASEESESRQDLFRALEQLKPFEKEAVVLTYIKGISHEEAGHLLQVPVEKMKEHLFSGIQSLRKAMGNGSDFDGCKEYHKYYIDYLERTLNRPKKVDFEVHIYHCPDCQRDLATFQEAMLTMINLTEGIEDFHVADGFMENVKGRIAETEKQRQQKNKKRKKIGLVSASVFAFVMSIGFFTGVFGNIYYAFTEEDEELLAFLQKDLGDRLNLEAESDGVIIRIKSAIADDVQTLVFYEIEDTKEDNQYFLNYENGVFVENDREILDLQTYPRYSPPDLESELNKEKNNVYHGKMSLLPIREDSGTIKLNITKLLKLIRNDSEGNGFNPYGNPEFETGEWNFEIPVTKQPSTEYALDEELEVEGVPVRFDKLTIAPTATILHYAFKNEKPEKRVSSLIFDNLEVNNKKVKADMYGGSYWHSLQDINWESYQVHFDPLFGEKPKEVNIHLGSINITFEDNKTIELDASQEYPQTFEYAGSTISIDKVDLGPPAEVVISNHEIENRAYDTIHFEIVGEDQNMPSSMEMDTEGVLIDKNGKVYDINKDPFIYEELEQPRFYLTVQRMRLHSNTGGEDVIPTSLNIYGYNTTKYLDDVVRIKVE